MNKPRLKERSKLLKKERLAESRLLALAMTRDTFHNVRRTVADMLFDTVALMLCVNSFFKSILEFSGQIEVVGEDAAIADGIIEAVRIKTESLDEGATELRDKSELVVKNISQVKPDVNELKLYIAATACSDSKGKIRVQNTFRDAGRFLRVFREKREAIYKRAVTNAEKLREQYLKNTLLFEVSTFDEMLVYSVTRLQNSQDAGARSLASFIRIKSYDIQKALATYGISQIAPQPHDMFSGREHEVLTVESSSGFSRGEIISLHNRGYKMGGVVLVRANVVAAR